MSDAKQGGDWPILRPPVEHGEVLTGAPFLEGVAARCFSDPCEPGIMVVALGDGINECKGAGAHDAKAGRVLCMSPDRSSS